MKIAIILNTSWNIYNFRSGLIASFQERGDEVLALAPEDDTSKDLKCRFIPIKLEAHGLNPWQDLSFVRQLWHILRKERPDVILSYTIKPNIYSSIVGGLLNIPVICNVSGLGTVFLWGDKKRKLASWLYRLTFRFNKWVFFQNEEDQRAFLELIPINPLKTSLLPGSGVNLTHFRPCEPTNQIPIQFLMVSRLLIDKGVYDYIEAIRIFQKKGGRAQFHLLGELDSNHPRTIQSAELNSWQEEGLINYHREVADVRPLVSQVDVMVLPSYREGTPRTLLEAGAMGKPMIATDVPGCRQVVNDGYNGFLCKLKDPRDLAAKMLLMASLTPEERNKMGQNARNWIEERFDEQLVIQLYHQKIAELAHQNDQNGQE